MEQQLSWEQRQVTLENFGPRQGFGDEGSGSVKSNAPSREKVEESDSIAIAGNQIN